MKNRVVPVVRGMTDSSGSGSPRATTEAVQDVFGNFGSSHANAGRLAWRATTAYSGSNFSAPANDRTLEGFDRPKRVKLYGLVCEGDFKEFKDGIPEK